MAEHDRSDDAEREAASLPEAVRRERAREEADRDDGGTDIPDTERRGRHATRDADDSLPGTERRERDAEASADAEQARSDTPSIPGTERRGDTD